MLTAASWGAKSPVKAIAVNGLTFSSAITPSYSGWVNGDDASSLTTTPTCSTTATSASGVGSYPSSCSGTTDPNYTSAITGDCAANGTITLAQGDVKACTITNTFTPAGTTTT